MLRIFSVLKYSSKSVFDNTSYFEYFSNYIFFKTFLQVAYGINLTDQSVVLQLDFFNFYTVRNTKKTHLNFTIILCCE